MEEEERLPPELVIGIPCNKDQTPQFWAPLMGLQIPFERWSHFEATGALTDSSRNEIAKWFYLSGAEWLFFVDDDVELYPDTLVKLLAHDKEFIAGIYFRGKPPCDPLMYHRLPNGWYSPFLEWPRDKIFPVDSVGLGCALIHRSVFQKILETHVIYERANGSLGMVAIEGVYKSRKLPRVGLRVNPKGETRLVQKVRTLAPNDLADNQKVPFFAFEYGRTEDHYFAELCATAGVEIWIDPTIELWHWKYQRVGRPQFEQVKAYLMQQEKEKHDTTKQDG